MVFSCSIGSDFTIASSVKVGYLKQAIPLHPHPFLHNAHIVPLLCLFHVFTNTCTSEWLPLEAGHMISGPLSNPLYMYLTCGMVVGKPLGVCLHIMAWQLTGL